MNKDKAEGMWDEVKGKAEKKVGELKDEFEKRKKSTESTTNQPVRSEEEEEERRKA